MTVSVRIVYRCVFPRKLGTDTTLRPMMSCAFKEYAGAFTTSTKCHLSVSLMVVLVLMICIFYWTISVLLYFTFKVMRCCCMSYCFSSCYSAQLVGRVQFCCTSRSAMKKKSILLCSILGHATVHSDGVPHINRY